MAISIAEFETSLTNDQPPEDLSVFLESLWYDAKGRWDKAHSLVDSLSGSTASWVHAYLHRKEGDTWNADYWYNKAGKKRPDTSLEAEWSALVKALI